MVWIGVDIGLRGAIAVYDAATGRVRTLPVPVKMERVGRTMRPRVDTAAMLSLARFLAALGPIRVAIETPTPRLRQGQASGIVSGATYGLVYMAFLAAGCDVVGVHPQTWKGRALKGGKAASVARATQLFELDSHQWRAATKHDHAEAALIAAWVSRKG